MGRTTTPKYVVEMSGFHRLHDFQSAWHGRAPSVAKLEQYVMEYVVSTMPGFCNERIGQAYGINMPSRAIVRENKPVWRILAEWKAPAFMVLPDPADYPKVARK